MPVEPLLSRRSFLLGSSTLLAALAACTSSSDEARPRGSTGSSVAAPPSPANPAECKGAAGSDALWAAAIPHGLVYGSSAATWQLSDKEYRKLYAREAAILFTEDDLLWYRLRPTPRSDLDFRYGDEIVSFAEGEGMLVLGAHLVWDQGFGNGWKDSDFVTMDERTARKLLFGTLDATVERYRDRVTAWIVANEVVDAGGLRTDVPWYTLLGDGYVEEAFNRAHDADPNALLLINEFGFEADDQYNVAATRRDGMLRYLDTLVGDDVPVHALGIQAHLNTSTFDGFDEDAYRAFLDDVAGRGLKILITEMDVLDDGEPKDIEQRDAAVADVYRRYLDVALDEPAVASLITFGLSDRYTWLEEDYPRDDGAARRPLPFDDAMKATPAFDALDSALASAADRDTFAVPPRC